MRESWLCDWLTWKCMRMDVACDILFPYYDTLNWIQSKQQLHFLSEFHIQSILSCMLYICLRQKLEISESGIAAHRLCSDKCPGIRSTTWSHWCTTCRFQVVGSSWMSTVRRFEIWNTSHAALLGSEMINLQNPIQYQYIPLSRILRNIGLPFHFPKWNTAAYIAVLWIRPKVPPTPRRHSGAFVPQCHALLAHLGVLKISWSVLPTWWIPVLVVYLLAGWLHDNLSTSAGDLEQRGQCHHEQRHHSPNLGQTHKNWHSTGHNLSCTLVTIFNTYLIPSHYHHHEGIICLKIWICHNSCHDYCIGSLNPWNIYCQGPTPQESNSSLDVTMILWSPNEGMPDDPPYLHFVATLRKVVLSLPPVT